MSQRSSGPAGHPTGEDWPDDLWPDTDDPGGAPGGPASGPPGHGPHGGGPASGPPGGPLNTAPPRWRSRLVALVVIGIVAAGAGAGIAAVTAHLLSGPSPAALSPGGRQVIVGPPGAGALPGGGSLPGGGAGQGGSLFLIGKVIAVSPTSITIGGPGHTITARVTPATRVAGAVSSVTGIKVGDQVSAQINEGGGRAAAVAISDPARPPAGGGLP